MIYGTLTNLVYAEDKSPKPKIGDGATLICWSDRRAYTIVDVNKTYIIATRDKVERTDRNYQKGPQEYSYRTDPEAVPERANLRKDGNYYIGGQVIRIGYRNEYEDPNF